MKNSKSLGQELQEVITKHTGQEPTVKEDPALKGYPFQVIFGADAKDNVKVTVRWPEDAPPAQSVRTVATMLHHISAGHWKPPMISAVKKQGADQKQAEIAGQILQEWGGATHTTVADHTCVPPRAVFRQRGQGNG